MHIGNDHSLGTFTTSPGIRVLEASGAINRELEGLVDLLWHDIILGNSVFSSVIE